MTPSSLADANGPVTVVGTSTVDGRPAVEYGVPTPGGTSSRSAAGHVQEHVTVAPFVAHVWLDGTGRIVRTSASIASTVTPAAGASVAGGAPSSYTSTLTVTLSGFGEPVHLSRPPASGTG